MGVISWQVSLQYINKTKGLISETPHHGINPSALKMSHRKKYSIFNEQSLWKVDKKPANVLKI